MHLNCFHSGQSVAVMLKNGKLLCSQTESKPAACNTSVCYVQQHSLLAPVLHFLFCHCMLH